MNCTVWLMFQQRYNTPHTSICIQCTKNAHGCLRVHSRTSKHCRSQTTQPAIASSQANQRTHHLTVMQHTPTKSSACLMPTTALLSFWGPAGWGRGVPCTTGVACAGAPWGGRPPPTALDASHGPPGAGAPGLCGNLCMCGQGEQCLRVCMRCLFRAL
jgi:hypothetical protein